MGMTSWAFVLFSFEKLVNVCKMIPKNKKQANIYKVHPLTSKMLVSAMTVEGFFSCTDKLFAGQWIKRGNMLH